MRTVPTSPRSLPRMAAGFMLCTVAAVGPLACGGESSTESVDRPETGYFIVGTVFDGDELQPIAAANLQILSAGGTVSTSASEDGHFILGPLPTRTAYQVSVTSPQHRSLTYTALPLPELTSEGDSRNLLRDVYLYGNGQPSPAFEITASAQDSTSRFPAGGRISLTVARNGLDPTLEPAPAGIGQSSLATGAYRQPFNSALPNESDVQGPALTIALTRGQALIEAGQLLRGATYRAAVEVPGYYTTVFYMTATGGGGIDVLLRPEDNRSSAADEGQALYFTGRIYDGVRQRRIHVYDIYLEYYDMIVEGTVDESGRYVVGPLLPDADYTIVIESPGYRSFLSHNRRIARFAFPEFESLYYDAFLYPDDVASSPVNFRFQRSDSEEPTSGWVRLTPTGGSALFEGGQAQPAAIDRQVWQNSEDLQQRTVTREFVDGQISFEAGDLTLGVTYRVTVFGVQDYSIAEGTTFRSGIDGHQSLTLVPVQQAPLALVYNSLSSGEPSATGTVTLRFNQTVRLHPAVSLSTIQRILNDNLSIVSPDANDNDERNTLRPIPDNADRTTYRGANITVSEDTLTLTWNRNQALETTDPGDPILSSRLSSSPNTSPHGVRAWKRDSASDPQRTFTASIRNFSVRTSQILSTPSPT